MGVYKHMCVGARMRRVCVCVCVGCVVCYQLRFMQICLAAEPSPAVDFLLTVSVASPPVFFLSLLVLVCPVRVLCAVACPFPLPNTH